MAYWLDRSLYFCTGPDELKAKNLARNARCVLTTGYNFFREGLDVDVEGEAVVVTDESLLRRLADMWERKYDFWHFELRDGAFHHDAGRALVCELAPKKAFSYGRGATYSTRRYCF